MAVKSVKRTWLRVGLYILLSFGGIVLIAAFLLNYYFSPILGGKLKKVVLKATDSLYHVDFSDARLNILQGKIVVYNLKLSYDTSVYLRQKQLHKAPAQLYTLQVNQVVLNHIHPFKIFFKHQVDVTELLIAGPQISLTSRPDPHQIKKPKDKRTLYQRLSQTFKLVHIGTISLSNVKLRYVNYAFARPAVSQFKELDLNATDLRIDSATQFDTTRFMYCHEFMLSLHNLHGQSANKLYGYQVRLVKFSTLTHRLDVDGLTYSSLGSPAQFFQKTYGDRFFIHLKHLQLRQLDFDINDTLHTIRTNSLILSKGSIAVFSNPRTNPKSFFIDKSITFPNRVIHTLPFKLKLDTIRVHDYDVRYEELNKKSKQTGYITFNQVNGNFYNITNDAASLRKKPLCHVNVDARFMGRAPTHISFVFNLADSAYTYSYQGHISNMDMQAINVATMPLASIKMVSGHTDKLSFDIKANRHGAKGNVTFLYHNLKIQLLNADSSSLKSLHLALASLLANALIIKNNNPDHAGDTPRVAGVSYVRPLNYPFFETLWRTLLIGIKRSAGLDAQTQQDADVKQAQKKKEEVLKKDDKTSRKQRRQEKRRLRKLKRAQKKARKQAAKERKQVEKEADKHKQE